jgi:hypothetical protein
MATMAIEDHIDAQIIIDGAEATEYPAEPQKDEMTGQEVTTKYVEVVSGAQFSFQGTISPRYRYGRENSLVMRVYIDGRYSGGVVWENHRHNHLTGSKLNVQCTWEGTGPSARKLMYHFADLETSERRKTSSFGTTLITCKETLLPPTRLRLWHRDMASWAHCR